MAKEQSVPELLDNVDSQKPLKDYGPEEMRADAEAKLHEAAKKFQEKPTAENLQEVQRQASRMQTAVPEKAGEVVSLLEELLPTSPAPSPSASPTKS